MSTTCSKLSFNPNGTTPMDTATPAPALKLADGSAAANSIDLTKNDDNTMDTTNNDEKKTTPKKNKTPKKEDPDAAWAAYLAKMAPVLVTAAAALDNAAPVAAAASAGGGSGGAAADPVAPPSEEKKTSAKRVPAPLVNYPLPTTQPDEAMANDLVRAWVRLVGTARYQAAHARKVDADYERHRSAWGTSEEGVHVSRVQLEELKAEYDSLGVWLNGYDAAEASVAASTQQMQAAGASLKDAEAYFKNQRSALLTEYGRVTARRRELCPELTKAEKALQKHVDAVNGHAAAVTPAASAAVADAKREAAHWAPALSDLSKGKMTMPAALLLTQMMKQVRKDDRANDERTVRLNALRESLARGDPEENRRIRELEQQCDELATVAYKEFLEYLANSSDQSVNPIARFMEKHAAERTAHLLRSADCPALAEQVAAGTLSVERARELYYGSEEACTQAEQAAAAAAAPQAKKAGKKRKAAAPKAKKAASKKAKADAEVDIMG